MEDDDFVIHSFSETVNDEQGERWTESNEGD